MYRIKLFSFFFIFISILILLLKYLPYYVGTEDIGVKDAENWLVAEQKTNDPERKFRCLRGALEIYAEAHIPTNCFDWRNIVSKMSLLHCSNNSLKLPEWPIGEFCMEQSIESLALLDSLVVSDLISYNNNDAVFDPFLGFLLKSMDIKIQEKDIAYVDMAVDIVINAIKKGARLNSFSSRYCPLAENEIMEIVLRISNYKLFEAMIGNQIISDRFLKSDITKHKVLECGNDHIIQYYLDKF